MLISKCDISDIYNDHVRFLSHILLLHLLNCFIDNKEQFLELNLFKMFLFTSISIIIISPNY